MIKYSYYKFSSIFESDLISDVILNNIFFVQLSAQLTSLINFFKFLNFNKIKGLIVGALYVSECIKNLGLHLFFKHSSIDHLKKISTFIFFIKSKGLWKESTYSITMVVIFVHFILLQQIDQKVCSVKYSRAWKMIVHLKSA